VVRQAGVATRAGLCRRAGFWFGEYAVVMDAPRSGQRHRQDEDQDPFLPKAEFEEIVRDEPRYFRDFAKLASLERRLSEGHVQATAWRRRPACGQLALLTQLKIEEQPLQGAVDLPLSQADLAAIVACRARRSTRCWGGCSAGRDRARFPAHTASCSRAP